ncbi:MAG: baseplate assembly protein [Desulfobacteraceae bacterium]|nr:baseplate assembly protein [Desulfobacteraceae bacterium]
MTEIYGQDIKLDSGMQALVSAGGELLLTQDTQTGVQDIKLRLFTRLGQLFYDKEFGSLIHNWIKEENTLSSRMGFEAEVSRRVLLDERVKPGTVDCSIFEWNPSGIKAKVFWEFINENHVYNLVIETNSKMEMVIKDVNPG